ncbi:MAG: hypothetical protein ACRDFQ_09275 [Anaerolineales bacterium]
MPRFLVEGLIWEQVRQGDSVEIWTIFAGDPPDNEHLRGYLLPEGSQGEVQPVPDAGWMPGKGQALVINRTFVLDN